MVQHTDLPSELQNLFGDTLIPPEVRQVINDFWKSLTNYERQQFIEKLQKQKDPLTRVLTTMMDAKSNKLKFADLRKIIGEHLKTALSVTEFTITFAKLEEAVWKVNISYPEKDVTGLITFNITALFSIDNRTGEVIKFQKGSYWTS